MRSSTLRSAVFTPAFPHLDAFLSRHVRSDHPLRHHPMWLGEEDISKLGKIIFKNSDASQTQEGCLPPHLPTVFVMAPTTFFLYNMDQLLPESEVRWQLPLAPAPSSLLAMQPYREPFLTKLEQFRRVKGFESNWWGTRERWLGKGGIVSPNAVPFVISMSSMKRYLHVSMLPRGEEVLKKSFVSGKTGHISTWLDCDEKKKENAIFCHEVEVHTQKYQFQTPLYFSHSLLRRAKIAIRPDAEPLCITNAFIDSDHINSRGISSHPWPVKSYQQYYHLSQLIVSDNYRIPLSVIEAERVNPGRPIHGVTGNILRVPELERDAIMNSNSPELAALIACDSGSETVCSIRDLESPHTVHGRSLWYLPHDVLEIGGMVDVNAVPVEATVANSNLNQSRGLYNVEQLLIPLEGYKAVGCIAAMSQPIWDKPLHPSGGETNTEEDVEVY